MNDDVGAILVLFAIITTGFLIGFGVASVVAQQSEPRCIEGKTTSDLNRTEGE